MFGSEDLEEGKPGGSAFSSEISEQDNEQALSELEGRARLIKQLTKDIHGEVESQNKFLESLVHFPQLYASPRHCACQVAHLTLWVAVFCEQGIEFEAVRRGLGGTVERFQKVRDRFGFVDLMRL